MSDWFNKLFSKIKDFGYNALSSIATNVGGAFGNALNQWLGTDLAQLGNSFVSALNNQGASVLNSITHGGPTGEQLYENAWTAQREDTLAQRTVEDYQAAGLNPALMYGSAPVANPSASANVGTPGVSLSDMLQIAMLPLQMKSAEASIGLTEAQASKAASETALSQQALEFNESLNPLILEAREVSNNLGRSQIKKIDSEVDKIAEEMKNIAAQTETEATKQLYNLASASLADAEADKIVQLLPYSIQLSQAQTEQAKSAARLYALQAAYQNKLLKSDYLDSLFASMRSQASSAEAKAAVDELRGAITSGKTIDLSSLAWSDKWYGKTAQFFADVSVNKPLATLDYILDKLKVVVPVVPQMSKSASIPVADYNTFPVVDY